MMTALTIIHAIVSILLIALVLLQFGKGAEAGLLMDTGASSILPQKGNIMTKITSVLAILFLGMSLGLAVLRSHQTQDSIFDKTAPMAAPLGDTSAPAAAPQAPQATTTTPSSEEGANPAAPATETQPASPAATTDRP